MKEMLFDLLLLFFEKANLVLTARRLQQLSAVQEECIRLGGTAEIFVADMNSTASYVFFRCQLCLYFNFRRINALVQSVKGQLDVLLLNHGVGQVII